MEDIAKTMTFAHMQKGKTMTLEELKEEAKRQGYNLIKKQTHIALKKCDRCRVKPHLMFYARSFDDTYCEFSGFLIQCPKCEKRTEVFKTERQAREAWNIMQEGETYDES